MFTLSIKMGNAEMQTPEDIRRALREVATEMARGKVSGVILDANGNNGGRYGMTEVSE